MPYGRGKFPKISARRPSDEVAVRPVIASNGVPFFQMRSVGSHSKSGKEKEGNKEKSDSRQIKFYFVEIFVPYFYFNLQELRVVTYSYMRM